MKAKSYLAGCIMIGAALEAELMAICHCFSDEVPSKLIPKEKNGSPIHLLRWSISQLLQVARECGWLPARLNLNEAWDQRRAHIGDYAIVVRDVRNLVHAGRYVRCFAKSRVTKKRIEICFEILEVASDHLQAKLSASIKAAMGEEEMHTLNSPPSSDRKKRGR